MSPHHVFLQRNAGAIAVNHKSTAYLRGPPQGSPKPPPPLSRGLRPPCSPRPAAPCALLLFSSGRSRLPHSGRASGAAAGPAAGDRREGSRAGPGAPRSGGEEALKTKPRPDHKMAVCHAQGPAPVTPARAQVSIGPEQQVGGAA